MSKEVLVRHHVTFMGDSGPMMVFAHGLGTDQRVWNLCAPGFARDHRVVRFDFMGAGQSDLRAWTPERYQHLDAHAEDLLTILHAIDAPPVIYVGHSAAASIGIMAATVEPERFSDLVLIAPNPRFVNDPPDYIGGFTPEDIIGLLDLMDRNMEAWAASFAPMVMKNEDRPELATALRGSLASSDPAAIRCFAEAAFCADVRPLLPRVNTPSLILQCADDSVAPRHIGAYLHAHMPRSTLRQMRATGHLPHMSQPDETTALIREYLAAAGR